MQKVQVNKSELLDKVISNREQHVNNYNDALDVYKKEATDKLRQMYETARDTGKIEQYLSMTEPECHDEDYDRVIAMLKMSVDTQIELSVHEFQNYVLDKWSWSNSFASSTMSYSAKKAK